MLKSRKASMVPEDQFHKKEKEKVCDKRKWNLLVDLAVFMTQILELDVMYKHSFL